MQRISWLMGGAAVVVALWAPLAGAQSATQDTSGTTATTQSVPQDMQSTPPDRSRGRSDVVQTQGTPSQTGGQTGVGGPSDSGSVFQTMRPCVSRISDQSIMESPEFLAIVAVTAS